MKKLLIMTVLLVSAFQSHADNTFNLKAFAQTYFDKMTATQAPNATKADLEAYLALLTDDIGHSHLPWVTDDSRLPDGKALMREGMTFYLGAHTTYEAKLLDVFTFNHSAIAIRYRNKVTGVHPESKQKIAYAQVMMEVLELENGQVAVIRKYHE